jgi:uncharacterized protein
VLSTEARDRLERKLVAAEQQSSNQIVVAIFRSLQGENLEDYSIRLARSWRGGQRGLDNGVIFLIFIDDRKMRLEVGYGLEASLTDAISGSIIRDVVAPPFREGRYAEGIEAGLDAIGRAIAGAYQSPVRQPSPQPLSRLLLDPGFLLVLAIFGLTGAVMIMRAVQRRRRGWTTGRHGWVVASPGFGGGSWGGSDSSSSGSSDGFSPGGGDFGGGGASGDW